MVSGAGVWDFDMPCKGGAWGVCAFCLDLEPFIWERLIVVSLCIYKHISGSIMMNRDASSLLNPFCLA